jgi:hypothetical protein
MMKSGDEIPMCNSAVILEKLIGQLVYGVTKGSEDDTNKPASSAPATGAASGAATPSTKSVEK